MTKWLGNTPSAALRHYVDPTEAAFELAQTWTPSEKGGAKSGALAAHIRAQQGAAESRTDSQDWPQNASGEAINASPCGTVRDYANALSGGAGN